MNAEQRKWVIGAFMAVALLVGFILMQALLKIAGVWDLEARIKSIEMIIRVGSILVGAGVFVGLLKHPVSNQFTTEVVSELMRVTWPTPKDTSSATVIVVIMVVVTGIILGSMDVVWASLVQRLIALNF